MKKITSEEFMESNIKWRKADEHDKVTPEMLEEMDEEVLSIIKTGFKCCMEKRSGSQKLVNGCYHAHIHKG